MPFASLAMSPQPKLGHRRPSVPAEGLRRSPEVRQALRSRPLYDTKVGHEGLGAGESPQAPERRRRHSQVRESSVPLPSKRWSSPRLVATTALPVLAGRLGNYSPPVESASPRKALFPRGQRVRPMALSSTMELCEPTPKAAPRTTWWSEGDSGRSTGDEASTGDGGTSRPSTAVSAGSLSTETTISELPGAAPASSTSCGTTRSRDSSLSDLQAPFSRSSVSAEGEIALSSADVEEAQTVPPTPADSQASAHRPACERSGGSGPAWLLARRMKQTTGLALVPGRAPAATATPKHARREIEKLGEAEKIFDRYSWESVLQEQGDGGKVVVCQPKAGGEGGVEYVMKIRSKESLQAQRFEEEFRSVQLRMLNLAQHPGVMPTHEVLEDDKFYYIVMKNATGGSLLEGLLYQFESGIIPAQALKKLIKEILKGVGFIHLNGILHRDIKPDNLVVYNSNGTSPMSAGRPGSRVMLIDFDHADPDFRPLRQATAQCFVGTVRWSAPEALLGLFSRQSDLYGVGAILYLLMTGKMPYDDRIFVEETRKDEAGRERRDWHGIYRRISERQVDWECSPWPDQPQCRDFCRWLLQFRPEERPASAEVALQHEWFAEE